MKFSFIFSALLLFVFSVSANGFIERNAKLKDNRNPKSLTLRLDMGIISDSATGKKLAHTLNQTSAMSVLDLLALEHANDLEKAKKSAYTTRYTYFKAVNRNCEGDRYAYSAILEVEQPTYTGSNEENKLMKDREEKLALFQDQLTEKYPDLTFEVTVECLQGFYETKDDAQKALESSQNQEELVDLVAFR